MSVPPELRVLCRRLDLTSTERLPAIVPSLIGHVTRCQAVLSASHETKGKDRSSAETAQLVHRFKTQINTLLNGRTAASRLTAVVLVKAVVDVSGWEGLRDSATWVRGLLSILNVS
jgi:pre-rRNA-processing protein RIX1